MTIIREFEKFPSVEEMREFTSTWDTILFDMDGTLLHTEPLHALAIKNCLPAVEFPLHYQGHSFQTPRELHEYFRGHNDERVYWVFKDILKDAFPDSLEGFIEAKNKQLCTQVEEVLLKQSFSFEVRSFLNDFKGSSKSLGLVSASQRPVVVSFSEKLNLSQWFSVIMGAEDTKKTKPDPMPYIEAMKRLGSEARRTLIFEDSQSGLESAIASGASVVKVGWYDS